MQEPWKRETKEKVINICKKWIQWELTSDEIRKLIGPLNWAVMSLFPEPENYTYACRSADILIDDIMEMDSLSDKEKDEAILKLVEEDKEELKDLARRVIKQIEIDTQEFEKEAEERGYCPLLTKDQINGSSTEN